MQGQVTNIKCYNRVATFRVKGSRPYEIGYCKSFEPEIIEFLRDKNTVNVTPGEIGPHLECGEGRDGEKKGMQYIYVKSFKTVEENTPQAQNLLTKLHELPKFVASLLDFNNQSKYLTAADGAVQDLVLDNDATSLTKDNAPQLFMEYFEKYLKAEEIGEMDEAVKSALELRIQEKLNE